MQHFPLQIAPLLSLCFAPVSLYLSDGKDLVVWQKSHAFVLEVYKYTNKFPKSELYGLTSQFRRSAVSIAANIAEGFKKKGRKDKVRFLNTSQGLLEECRYYLILSKDLNYGDNKTLDVKLQDVSKLINAYSKALQNSDS